MTMLLEENVGLDVILALAKFKEQAFGVSKNQTAEAGRYSYDYVSLNQIIELDGLLYTFGLMFVDSIVNDGVYTRLFHIESTQFISSLFPWDTPAHGKEGIVDGLNFQDNGKTITYGKRYNRLSILGLRQDDKDTETPVVRKPAKERKDILDTGKSKNDEIPF